MEETNEVEYVVYLTTENGRGFVWQLWKGSDIEDFEIMTDLIPKGCKLSIEIDRHEH